MKKKIGGLGNLSHLGNLEEKTMNNVFFVIFLIVLGVVSRVVPHPANVTPLAAIALFGGVYLSKRWAIITTLLTMIISDVVLGWHSTIGYVYASMVATLMLGFWLKKHPGVFTTLSVTLLSSLLFFLVTNFGVWVSTSLYTKNAEGLLTCFIAALPFFRNSLFGDIVYTTVLFGGYEGVQQGIRGLRRNRGTRWGML